MSTFNSKAHYHPVSQLAGNLTNGSYMLPGNGYYSVTGTPPRVKFDHKATLNDPKYIHNQAYRIDPINSLMNLKKETSLTHYYPHAPEVEACRDRYIFVEKFASRNDMDTQDPSLSKNPGLVQFKEIADSRREYHLNQVQQLPDVDAHVLPDKDHADDAYRLYEPQMPYDMMTLRETHKFNPSQDGTFANSAPNFVTVNNSVSKP